MKHITLLPLAALMALTLLLTVSVPPADAGQPEPAAAQATAAIVPPFGVQLHSWATDEGFDDVLVQAKALGVRWLRLYVFWGIIQPNAPAAPGCDNCNWSYTDRLLQMLVAQGFTPIVTIWGNPTWAATYGNGPIDKVPLSYFGAFVSALAQRYPQVQYWEFYNEPDNWASMGMGWGGQGAQYAQMLAAAYNAIHPGGAPGAGAGPQYVVFGGVAAERDYCTGHPNNNCFDNSFIGTVIANANGSPLFDRMGIHFYASYAGRYTPPNIVGKALALKRAYPFINSKPFLVTELGRAYEDTSDINHSKFSHEVAARQVVQMYAALMAGKAYGVNIAAGSWYTLEHYETLAGPAIRKWGLLDEELNPWPLEGGAYKTTAAELGNTTYLGLITATGVTGYKFRAADGTVHAVLWATNPLALTWPKFAIYVTKSSLRWLDKLGNATTVFDNKKPGDPDTRLHWIKVTVTASPIFVEYK